MAQVQVQQSDAHLVASPKFEWVQLGSERRAKATFVAISNHVRGSGDARREKATSIRWTTWGPQAEAHAVHLGRGSHVNVIGRMESTQYTDADTGRTVYGFDFIVDSVHYLDNKETAQARRTRGQMPVGNAATAADAAVAAEPRARMRGGSSPRPGRAPRSNSQPAA